MFEHMLDTTAGMVLTTMRLKRIEKNREMTWGRKTGGRKKGTPNKIKKPPALMAEAQAAVSTNEGLQPLDYAIPGRQAFPYSGWPSMRKISLSSGLIGRFSVSPVGSRRRNHLL
jgi:hypothetical protein